MFWSDKGKERGARRSQQEIRFKVRICFLLNNGKCIQVLIVLRCSPVDYKVLDIRTQPLQKACSLHYLHSLKIFLSSFAVALTCLFFSKCGEGGMVFQSPRVSQNVCRIYRISISASVLFQGLYAPCCTDFFKISPSTMCKAKKVQKSRFVCF